MYPLYPPCDPAADGIREAAIQSIVLGKKRKFENTKNQLYYEGHNVISSQISSSSIAEDSSKKLLDLILSIWPIRNSEMNIFGFHVIVLL